MPERHTENAPMSGRTFTSWLCPAFAATLAVFVGLWGCAHVEAPPGGPPDKIPPYVIGAFPAPEATGVPRDVALQLQFSEWVKADGLQGQVILSPALPGKVRIQHDGDKIVVDPDSLLRPNTTYRLVVPAQVKDMNGVSLDSAFQLVFSTGQTLDSGAISGKVFLETGGAVKQAWAALYAESREWALPRRGERRKLPWPDSVANAWREKPAYLTPVDTTGNFRFDALPPGRYGVLVFVDANQNQLPDNGENMAVGPAALRIADVTPPSLNLRLGVQDTQGLRLAKVTWSAASAAQDGKVSGALKVQFNRAISLPKGRPVGAFTVKPTQGKPEMAAFRLQPLTTALSPEGEIELWFTGMPANERMTLRVTGLVDDLGIPLDTARASLSFDATAMRDSLAPSTAPVLTVWRPEALTGKPLPLLKEAAAPISEVVVRSSSPLTDSALNVLSKRLQVRADSVPLAKTAQREGPFGITLRFAIGQGKLKTLYFGLKGESAAAQTSASKARDSAAKPEAEQSLAKWNCLAPEEWASLRLQPETQWLGWTGILRRTGSQDTRIMRFEANREIKLDSLVPGVWRLWVFADQDGNGLWHGGSIKPWRSQEPAAAWPDTLGLKAGSETGPIKVGGSFLR
jgi:Bacterial Ig-like domain